MELAKREYFKQKLLKMRKELTDELNRKYNEAINLGNDGIQDSGDEAYNLFNKNMMLGKVETNALKLQLVEQALDRIENDTYGICIECEEEISEKRLEYVPFARYCADCKSKLENKGVIKI